MPQLEAARVIRLGDAPRLHLDGRSPWPTTPTPDPDPTADVVAATVTETV